MEIFKIKALQTLRDYTYIIDNEGISLAEYCEEWEELLQEAISELEELEHRMQDLCN